MGLWTAAANGNGDVIVRSIRDSSSMQQLEKKLEQAVMRLAIMHLQNNEVDQARDEFLDLNNHFDLVEELVQSAYSNTKVKLLPLVNFVCKIPFF